MINFIFSLRFFSILMLLSIIIIAPFGNSWKISMVLAQCFLLSSLLSFLETILDERRGGVSFMYEFFMLFFVALPAIIQISEQTFSWFATFEPLHVCWTFGLLALSQIVFKLVTIIQQRFFRKKKI